MKRLFGISVTIVLVMICLTAPALAQKPVKVGVLTPLSPPGDAAAGQFIVRGAKMGMDDVNELGGVLGGRKIELVNEDDSGTPEKGVAGFRRLAVQDQAVAVLGQYHSSVMTAVQTLADEFKIPIFATNATASAITERHLNYTFRTHPLDADRVKLWTRWIREKGLKRVALITENTDFGVGIIEETKKQFQAMGVQIELKTTVFDRAVVDFTPQMLDIKNWKPDLFLNGGLGSPLYLIIRQAYDVGLCPAVPMLVATDPPSRPEYWKNVGEKGNYVTFVVYYHPMMKLTARGEAFRKKYKEKFKEDPVYSALNSYAQVRLIADALNAAKSDKGEALISAFLSNKFEGWNATISFSRGEGPYWQQWTPPILLTQYTRPDMPFTDAKIVFPPEFQTGNWVPGPRR